MEVILQRIARLEALVETTRSEVLADRESINERLETMIPLIEKANENRERIRTLEVEVSDQKAHLETSRLERIDLLKGINEKTNTLEERLRKLEIKGGVALGVVTTLQSILSIVLHTHK